MDTAPATDRRSPAAWLAPLLVVLAGLAAYANCFEGAFVLDDLKHIVVREQIRSLWPPGPLLDGRAVVTVSLAVNHALGGLEPAGYHAVNLAVHLAAGLVLCGIVRRTVLRAAGPGRPRIAAAAPWIAAAAATLWVVHPLQTGAVTYVIQRAESMMGLLYLLTLYGFIRGVEAGGRGRSIAWHATSVLACIAGMYAKAVIMTAPAMVLLYDWVFVGPTAAAIVRRRWLAHAALFATLLVLVVNGFLAGILDTTPSAAATVGFRYAGVSAAEYARTQPEVILYYLRLALWPQRLCLDYAWPVAQDPLAIAANTAVVVALALAAAWGVLRRHWLGYLGAWLLVILSPTSSFVPVRDLAFEHRMYLPLAAITTALAVLATLALARAPWPRRRIAALAAAAAIVATGALAARTHLRNRDYHDPVVLWRAVTEFRPANPRAWNQYGNALQAEDRCPDAIAAYDAALAIDPDLWNAHANRAACLVRLGRLDAALAAWDAALAGTDDPVYVQYNRANTLLALGRTTEAIAGYEAALAIDPGHVPALIDLGRAHGVQGRFELALPRLDAAIALEPDRALAHVYRGHALRETGLLEEAAAAYRLALELAPDDPVARDALAYTESLMRR